MMIGHHPSMRSMGWSHHDNAGGHRTGAITIHRRGRAGRYHDDGPGLRIDDWCLGINDRAGRNHGHWLPGWHRGLTPQITGRGANHGTGRRLMMTVVANDRADYPAQQDIPGGFRTKKLRPSRGRQASCEDAGED